MIRILDALLAPIARLAVARGVPFPQVIERFKLQYLRGAEALTEGATDSRISVMTGLQRRDIARLRDLPQEGLPPVNHLAKLVRIWRQELPAALPRSGDASFDTLAARIRKDVHSRTLLEQLLAAGTVVSKGDQVRLVAEAYQPLAGSEDQLNYLAANGADHLAAGVANVMDPASPFFEQAAHFNALSAEAVAEIDALFRARQMQVLQEVAERAANLQATSPGQKRFRAGGYFYAEDQI